MTTVDRLLDEILRLNLKEVLELMARLQREPGWQELSRRT